MTIYTVYFTPSPPVKEFINAKKKSGLSDRTVNVYVDRLRYFSKWAVDGGLLQNDPFKNFVGSGMRGAYRIIYNCSGLNLNPKHFGVQCGRGEYEQAEEDEAN